MNVYHTIRAFLKACIMLPFVLLAMVIYPVVMLSDLLRDWLDGFQWHWFNPIKTYRIVQKNNTGEFHKWTGKRLAKLKGAGDV